MDRVDTDTVTLARDLEGWLGRRLSTVDVGSFDIGTLLGATCTLVIKHEVKNNKDRASVVTVMRPAKGTPTRLPLINPGIVLALNEPSFDYTAYNALPDWLKDIIAKSPEYRAATSTQPAASPRQRLKAALTAPLPVYEGPGPDDEPDDIPF